MMFKTLLRKKLWHFRAYKGPRWFAILGIISLAPLLTVCVNSPMAVLTLFVPVAVGYFIAPVSAITAFDCNFANQAGRFLDYLPLKRSTIWWSSYLFGLGKLCLLFVLVSWPVVLLSFVPLGDNHPLGELRSELRSEPGFNYMIPGRFALIATCGGTLFWMFSIATFFATYYDAKNYGKVNPLGIMAMLSMGAPVGVMIFVTALGVCPSGLAMLPILLTSGLLYSAGSFALFAWVPKHITLAKHAILGLGLFLATSGVLLGHIYVKSLEWRKLDLSLPFRIVRICEPPLNGQPNLILAIVHSYRSGNHYISIDIENGTYHDLGRGLTLLEVPENDSGRLQFLYDPDDEFNSSGQTVWFTSMAPDATKKQSFEILDDRYTSSSDIHWLPERNVLVHNVYSRELKKHYLRVLDSNGKLLKQFEIDSYDFLVSPAGQALALAPEKTNPDGTVRETSEDQPGAYIRIDLDSGSIHRFDLSDKVIRFSKDLKRAICSRERLQDGRRYQSRVLVELPTLEERVLLSEDEFPPLEVTEQVNMRFSPNIATREDQSILKVNPRFDTALWTKQWVEGDYFRRAVVAIDLDTGEHRVVVPESAIPKTPVVMGGDRETPIVIHEFIADQEAFRYAIGSRTYLCEIEEPRSILLADNSIPPDGIEEDARPWNEDRDGFASLSGQRAFRHIDIYRKQTHPDEDPPLAFAAIEIFQDGKPTRVYTSRKPIMRAMWLDERRIVFEMEETIHVLESSSGQHRQIFPPVGSADTE